MKLKERAELAECVAVRAVVRTGLLSRRRLVSPEGSRRWWRNSKCQGSEAECVPEFLREGSGRCGVGAGGGEGRGAGSVHWGTLEAAVRTLSLRLGVWAMRALSRKDGFRWSVSETPLQATGQPGVGLRGELWWREEGGVRLCLEVELTGLGSGIS